MLPRPREQRLTSAHAPAEKPSHPAARISPMTNTYDVVVLGAGSGGYAAALRAAQLGQSVALIEKDKVGGTCLHRGCIPTKAFLHAAEVADSAREAEQFGVHASLDGVDLAGVVGYADSVITRLYKGLQGLVKSRKITVVEGAGTLVTEGDGVAVEAGGERYVGRYTVLASGSQSKTIGLDIDGERFLTSEHALRMQALPNSAIILGGGVIGVEFASAWRSFGVDVTIVEALPSLVPAEEPEVAKALERAFKKRGIAFHTSAPMKQARKSDDGVAVTLENGTELTADVLLVAVGRGPVTSGMGYEECGLAMERGFVATTERLETNLPRVFAVGDIVPGLQLAHRGFAHGMFVAEEIAHREGKLDAAPRPVRDVEIPRATYCEPEIASVGITEEKAKLNGEVVTVTYDLAGNGKSQILKTAGFVKLVAMKDGPIVGASMIGARASEQVGELMLLTDWEATAADVAPYVHAHPSQNEAIGEAALALAGKPLHSHS